VGVALPGPTHGRESLDDDLVEPDHTLALLSGLRLKTDGADRKRGGDRLEGGGADAYADHDSDVSGRASPSKGGSWTGAAPELQMRQVRAALRKTSRL